MIAVTGILADVATAARPIPVQGVGIAQSAALIAHCTASAWSLGGFGSAVFLGDK